jgi:phosphosulfolactate synthase
MSDAPFAFIELPPERQAEKPRTRGLTMLADFGMPLGRQEDVLELAGRYVDLAKIATGTARLYEKSYLQRKLAAYRTRQVRPFIGGQFQEYVFATEGWRALAPFLREAKALGFDTVEISDNCVPLTDDERHRQIRIALDCGLEVFGEVGSKDRRSDAQDLLRQAEVCFAAGCELVLVEAAELVEDGVPNQAMLDALRRDLDVDRALFELPGPWISGVTLAQVSDLKKLLIAEFGPAVNLGNLKADDLIETEALRVGLGVVGPKGRQVAEQNIASENADHRGGAIRAGVVSNHQP